MILLSIPAGRLRWQLVRRSTDEAQHVRDEEDMRKARIEEWEWNCRTGAEHRQARWPLRLHRLGLTGPPRLSLPTEWDDICSCEVCTRQRQRRKEPNT